MCHRSSEIVAVKVPADLSFTGEERWKDAAIDGCIASLVKALQRGGIDMRASCCGHGRAPGDIQLADGRTLLILSPEQYAEYAAFGTFQLCAVNSEDFFSVPIRAGMEFKRAWQLSWRWPFMRRVLSVSLPFAPGRAQVERPTCSHAADVRKRRSEDNGPDAGH